MYTKFLLIRYSILRNILYWSYMIYFVYEISTIYNENIFLCILWYNIRLIEVNLTRIYDHESHDDRSFKLWIRASPRRFLYAINYYLLYDKYELYPIYYCENRFLCRYVLPEYLLRNRLLRIYVYRFWSKP